MYMLSLDGNKRIHKTNKEPFIKQFTYVMYNVIFFFFFFIWTLEGDLLDTICRVAPYK